MNLENEISAVSGCAFNFALEDNDSERNHEEVEPCLRKADAISIAKQYAEERYHQAQYDLIVMITQDMFNACSLNLPLEYVGNLKKQLKSKLATETEK